MRETFKTPRAWTKEEAVIHMRKAQDELDQLRTAQAKLKSDIAQKQGEVVAWQLYLERLQKS